MEAVSGTQTGEPGKVQLGKAYVVQPVNEGMVLSVDEARMHRELAIGNFFVALRGLVNVGTKFLNLALEQEAAERGGPTGQR